MVQRVCQRLSHPEGLGRGVDHAVLVLRLEVAGLCGVNHVVSAAAVLHDEGTLVPCWQGYRRRAGVGGMEVIRIEEASSHGDVCVQLSQLLAIGGGFPHHDVVHLSRLHCVAGYQRDDKAN